MYDFSFWFTAILLIVLTIVLVKEFIQAEISIFSVLIILLLAGIIDPDEAFSGFSNHGMLTVGFLFVVVGALTKTGVINFIGKYIMGNKGNVRGKLFRLLPPVTATSAFFNNTPIVAMMIPVIHTWTKKNNMPVSKFLIPLSYAAILGGTCTLIGTSSNLVVHGLMLDKGIPGMSFFEISRVGIPVALVGLLVILTLGCDLLPDRKDPITYSGEHIREFVVVLKVEKEYPYIGSSIEKAGLRHLKGLFLFQIERNGSTKTPVNPSEKIELNDFLFFTGIPETILELQRIRGLLLVKEKTFDLKNFDSELYEAFEVVISQSSPLLGKNVRESGFRSTYDAVILAIHRSGERIKQKIGDIIFHSGDTLLILSKQDFINKWYNSKDFYLVSRSVSINSGPRWKSLFSLFVLIIMIVIMASGLLPVVVVAGSSCAILILFRCLTIHSAFECIEWRVLLIIASAFGVARGLENSGLAHFIAESIIELIGGFGPLGLLAGVYFVTNLYTEIITNNAAAALLVPVVISVANQAALDPRPFLISVIIAASASFSTPIGYQTNLMVYGPGGYKFTDYLRVGIPMNLIIGVLGVFIIYILYF